jgi:hypothetical protein
MGRPKGSGTAASKVKGRIAASVGTAGAAGTAGLSSEIERAMATAAQKAIADGGNVEAQKRAMQAARENVVKAHAEAEAKAAAEAERRTTRGE